MRSEDGEEGGMMTVRTLGWQRRGDPLRVKALRSVREGLRCMLEEDQVAALHKREVRHALLGREARHKFHMQEAVPLEVRRTLEEPSRSFAELEGHILLEGLRCSLEEDQVAALHTRAHLQVAQKRRGEGRQLRQKVQTGRCSGFRLLSLLSGEE